MARFLFSNTHYATRLLIVTFLATAVKDLHLDHWPEAVRNMAAYLRGLVEGVLKKKAATLVERHDPDELLEAYARAADSDLSS